MQSITIRRTRAGSVMYLQGRCTQDSAGSAAQAVNTSPVRRPTHLADLQHAAKDGGSRGSGQLLEDNRLGQACKAGRRLGQQPLGRAILRAGVWHGRCSQRAGAGPVAQGLVAACAGVRGWGALIAPAHLLDVRHQRCRARSEGLAW